MELVVMISLLLGLMGLMSVPCIFFAWKPISVKIKYWKNKRKGAKIVDYFTSDGDHDVFCVTPDENGMYRVNGKIHNITEGTVKWSRFYDGRIVVNQDISAGTINPITDKELACECGRTILVTQSHKTPPELIEGTMQKIQLAERKTVQLLAKAREQEFMLPLILCGVGICVVICWLVLSGQTDVITACAPTAQIILGG